IIINTVITLLVIDQPALILITLLKMSGNNRQDIKVRSDQTQKQAIFGFFKAYKSLHAMLFPTHLLGPLRHADYRSMTIIFIDWTLVLKDINCKIKKSLERCFLL